MKRKGAWTTEPLAKFEFGEEKQFLKQQNQKMTIYCGRRLKVLTCLPVKLSTIQAVAKIILERHFGLAQMKVMYRNKLKWN